MLNIVQFAQIDEACGWSVPDTGRTRYKGRTCESCLTLVSDRESHFCFTVRKEQNIQARSRQVCDEVVKFYTIAIGMCVGHCEGPTLYKVAVDERVRIAHVIKHSRSPRNMMVQ